MAQNDDRNDDRYVILNDLSSADVLRSLIHDQGRALLKNPPVWCRHAISEPHMGELSRSARKYAAMHTLLL